MIIYCVYLYNDRAVKVLTLAFNVTALTSRADETCEDCGFLYMYPAGKRVISSTLLTKYENINNT